VDGAFRDVQLLCQNLHWQASRVTGETFQNAENTFDLTAGHGWGPDEICVILEDNVLDTKPGTVFRDEIALSIFRLFWNQIPLNDLSTYE
jgi:hypothetical protein